MIKTKDITILGSGISGLGSAKLAKKFGINVFVSDKNSIKEKVKKHLNNNKISFKENGHDVERLLKSDEVIISPGISFSNLKKTFPNIKEEKFISELEFASRYTDAYLIAVTGSNGKTTTASLIYHLLKNNGFNVGLAGNIGVSFADSINTELIFDGMNPAYGYWRFTEKNGITKVVWGMKGEMPFFIRFMTLFFDAMAGRDFEEGLKGLKERCESFPSRSLSVEVVDMTEQHFL